MAYVKRVIQKNLNTFILNNLSQSTESEQKWREWACTDPASMGIGCQFHFWITKPNNNHSSPMYALFWIPITGWVPISCKRISKSNVKSFITKSAGSTHRSIRGTTFTSADSTITPKFY